MSSASSKTQMALLNQYIFLTMQIKDGTTTEYYSDPGQGT